MVEVFRTNVNDPAQARMLLALIHQAFSGCAANFDLEDCDKILRIESESAVQPRLLIDLLKNFGCEAEVLN